MPDYEVMGCLEGALATYADQVYADLDEDEQERARRAFVQLVQPGEGTEDTRRIATREELGDESWKLIQKLADKRLVVTGRDAQGREIAEVIHEALIQRWGRFWEWMNSDRAFRAWQERLRGSLRQWQESGQDEGALLAGAPLAVAHGWLAQRTGELNPTEINYIQASQALQARQQKERQRRRQWTIIGLTAGMLVAIILAAFAIIQRQEAITQRQAALRQASAGLAAQALAELEGTQSERAVLLALEALENYPYTPQAESALARAVQESLPFREIEGHPDSYNGYYSLAWSPDGKYIAAGSGSDLSGGNAVQILNAATGRVNIELPVVLGFYEGTNCGIYYMAWSPDSKRLAFAANDSSDSQDCHSFYIYDADKGTMLLTLETHGETSLDWSPDGQTLLSVSQDGVVRLWDAGSGTLLHENPGQQTDALSAQFSPDGTRFATTSRNGSILILDTANGNVSSTIGVPQNITGEFTAGIYLSWGYGLTWSPDGNYLATGSEEGSVNVWEHNIWGESDGSERTYRCYNSPGVVPGWTLPGNEFVGFKYPPMGSCLWKEYNHFKRVMVYARFLSRQPIFDQQLFQHTYLESIDLINELAISAKFTHIWGCDVVARR